MKKLLCFFLCISMLLSVSACKKTESETEASFSEIEEETYFGMSEKEFNALAEKTELPTDFLKQGCSFPITVSFDGQTVELNADMTVYDLPEIDELLGEDFIAELKNRGIEVDNGTIEDHDHEGNEDLSEPPTTEGIMILKPGQTTSLCKAPGKYIFDFFIYGVTNDTDKDIPVDKARISFIKSMGTEDSVAICGITPSMTKEEAIATLGEPTQIMTTEEGYTYMAYCDIYDGHAYMLDIAYTNETVITVNIDNTVMYDVQENAPSE